MASPAASKAKRGQQADVPKTSWPLDASIMVVLEACDGHRIVADRNCVAVARRLADMIPPLIAPPPPPVAAPRGGAASKNEPPPPPPKNRGPSQVTDLFEQDLGPGQPTPITAAVASGNPTVAAAAASNNGAGAAVVPTIKVDCLDGRQLEAAMRIAYLKYVGDYTADVAQRKTVSLERLGISPDELMAIGAILGL